MKKTSETIVFFGSGPVAAKSLEQLHEIYEIEAVVTKPQPLHHKAPFPVLEIVKKLGLPVFTPANQVELSKLFASKPVRSSLGVVIDYGFILKKDVLDYFRLGIINSHFSLLPRWRGADPISFAILNGDRETGVSLMKIVEALDEGPLIAQDRLPIAAGITTPELTDQLINMSTALLKENLGAYMAGQLAPRLQPASVTPTYSRKLTKQDGILDFTKSAEQLEREVRAFIEWPRSRTRLAGIDITITKAHVEPDKGLPGTLWHEGKKLGVYTSDGILVIDTLVPAGKKAMAAEAFLAGYGHNL